MSARGGHSVVHRHGVTGQVALTAVGPLTGRRPTADCSRVRLGSLEAVAIRPKSGHQRSAAASRRTELRLRDVGMGRRRYGYELTQQGLEVYFFGSEPAWTLRPQNMVGAHVVDSWFGGFEFGAHPLNLISLDNRLRRKHVLIEKRGWPRFIAITPDDPEAFVAPACLWPEAPKAAAPAMARRPCCSERRLRRHPPPSCCRTK